jgi:hypothetical protein
MATVMDGGAVTPMGRERPGAEKPSRLPITLSDLITAIQDVVGPEEDGLVVATVRHLLRAGRLTGPGPGGAHCHARSRGCHRCAFSSA